LSPPECNWSRSSRDEYDEEHLPGAIHLPLKSLTREVAERTLDRGRPVIVYCWDAL
jgi:rhodanese-related sulfurtransferase